MMALLRLKNNSLEARKDTLRPALYMGLVFLPVSPTPLALLFDPVVAGADLKDANEGVRLK
jgi:hypothetical protein